MKHTRQPAEVAPSYVFLTSEQELSYMTEEFLHVNGGVIVNW
jgi:NAD(P)-dependent dehydrogenase (short-subunit alcohol dehydrogenase family)